MEIINAVIPVLACMCVLASHSWPMTASPPSREHQRHSFRERMLIVAAYVLFAWYYSTNLFLVWIGLA